MIASGIAGMGRRAVGPALGVGLGLVLQSHAAAETRPRTADATNDFGELSLAQLLDPSVTVASKTGEKASAAPASVTAYSEDDLRALGDYTIYELANQTAGYGSTVMYGERVLETRGQKAGSFNDNKHLVYVDGIPVNHARNGKAPIEEELPLDFAQSVEFLRGPASALYGTGAFFGVVNVVPKELHGSGTLMETRFAAGSADEERRFTGNAIHADGDRTLRLSVGYYDKAASRAYVGTTNDPLNRYWDSQQSLFLNATYGLRSTPLAGLQPGLVYLRKEGGLGESWNENGSSHEINDLAWETLIPYLKYERGLTDRLSLRSYVMWNRGRETGRFTGFSKEQLQSYDGTGDVLYLYRAEVDAWQAQGELAWIGEATSFLAGINLDTRKSPGGTKVYSYIVKADPGPPYLPEPGFTDPSDRYTTFSVYGQLRHEVPLLRGLILTAGARDDFGVSPTQTFNQLSPRIGLVQRFTDNVNFRAFVGTALRAPGIKEIGLNKEAKLALQAQGKPTSVIGDLESETIRTFEAGPVLTTSRLSLSLTAFSNQTNNALDGTSLGTVNYFANGSGHTRALGLEAEGQVAPIRALRVLANYSWSMARDPANKDVEDVPVQTANLTIFGRITPADLTLSLAGRWIEAFRVAGGPDGGGFFQADANLIWDFAPGFDLELRVRNVLDDRAKLPKHGTPDVPLPRRNVRATLAYRF